MEIPIVYEDADLVVINKPSGLLTHPKHATDQSASVVSWLLEKYPQVKGIGDDPLRPAIVHRLDRDTSGLLIIAKTPASFTYLKQQFQDRKIKKTYLALVYGCPGKTKDTITAPLGKIGIKQSTTITGKQTLDAKEAITNYSVTQRFTDYTLLTVQPLTGRTNQIRVHLKFIGHPIVCDPIYAGRKAVCPPELGRLFLHALRLEFVSPAGQALALETALAPELESFLGQLPILKN